MRKANYLFILRHACFFIYVSFCVDIQGGLGPQGDKGFPGLAGPQVMISLGFVAYLQKNP